MVDGTRLVARIWLPRDAERTPVPALLEYIPYRKNDGTVAPLKADVLRPTLSARRRTTDLISGKSTLVVQDDAGRLRLLSNGLEFESTSCDEYGIVEGEPLPASVRCTRTAEFQRGSWHVRLQTKSKMTADTTHFHVTNQLEAFERNGRVFARNWSMAIPRDGV